MLIVSELISCGARGREEHSHHLKLLDHKTGLSFTNSFDFPLSTLLYRGFHQSNSATRLQALRLFCQVTQPVKEVYYRAVSVKCSNIAIVTAIKF